MVLQCGSDHLDCLLCRVALLLEGAIELMETIRERGHGGLQNFEVLVVFVDHLVCSVADDMLQSFLLSGKGCIYLLHDFTVWVELWELDLSRSGVISKEIVSGSLRDGLLTLEEGRCSLLESLLQWHAVLVDNLVGCVTTTTTTTASTSRSIRIIIIIIIIIVGHICVSI